MTLSHQTDHTEKKEDDKSGHRGPRATIISQPVRRTLFTHHQRLIKTNGARPNVREHHSPSLRMESRGRLFRPQREKEKEPGGTSDGNLLT